MHVHVQVYELYVNSMQVLTYFSKCSFSYCSQYVKVIKIHCTVVSVTIQRKEHVSRGKRVTLA